MNKIVLHNLCCITEYCVYLAPTCCTTFSDATRVLCSKMLCVHIVVYILPNPLLNMKNVYTNTDINIEVGKYKIEHKVA